MEGNVIINGIGSPRIWLYIGSGELMRDFDERPISKYLIDFSYTYNEEQDDECKMTFKFPNLRSFDLPYFKQDTVFEVEWGYVTGGGKIIKSPKRVIAIRDLETTYEIDGIKLSLSCTDLVSYIKGMKTNVIRNYTKTINPGTNTVDNRFANNSVLALGMFINERTAGNITMTQRRFDEVLRINTTGELKAQSTKNPLLNTIKPDQLVGKEFIKRPRVEDVVIKGGAKSFDWLIKKTLDDYENSTNNPDFGKPQIADTTDNNIEIKMRDFSQPIFKAYTWAGGNGELLSFSTSTNTRKTKETKSASSGIDPFTKKVSNAQIDTIDTSKFTKYKKGDLDTVYKKMGDIYKDTYMNKGVVKQTLNDKISIGTYQGKEIDVKPEKITIEEGPIFQAINTLFDKESDRVTEKDIYDYRTYNYKDIFQSPDWKSYLGQKMKLKKLTNDTVVSKLASTTIEKIQRKFEGEAKVIGDPTLIKGKLYQFNNLRKEDIGKWYSVTVKHDIKMDSGYTCSLTLMRNPKPIGLSAKTTSINPVFDRKTKKLNLEIESDITNNTLYEQEDEDENMTVNNMDENKSDMLYREASPIDDMEQRSQILQSEKDVIDNLDNNDEYVIARINQITKPEPNTGNN